MVSFSKIAQVIKQPIVCLCFVFVGMSFFAVAQNIEDFYKIETINIPKGIELEVGGLAFNDKGQLGVTTRRGEMWLLDHPESNTPKFKRFASGMHEALGLSYKEGSYYTVQRSELTKLTDIDGDDEADYYEAICNWEVSGNYHEYSFGPEILPNGDMLITLNLGWKGGGKSFRKWRGWMMKVTPKGELFPIASGMRSPAGFGLNKNGDIFYAENQGDWVGSGRVSHVEKGDFMGHPEGLKWTGEKGSPLSLKMEDIDGSLGLTMYEQSKIIPELKAPSVWFPHAIMGISTSDIKLIPDNFGPFIGQLLVGDQGHSKVMRLSQEIVNGVYQGACFPFLEGFQSGVLRLRWSEKGHLYVGMTSRGWGSTGKDSYGLQRVEWSGKTPFEMKHIAVTSNGYEIEFTESVDEKVASDPNSYSISDFNYHYWPTYGSPIINKEKRGIHKVEVLDEGYKVRLYLDNMRLGNIYQIKAEGVKNNKGSKLLNDTGYYTLNQMPGGLPFKSIHHGHGDHMTNTVAEIKESTKRVRNMPLNWNKNEVETINISTVPGLKFSKKLIEIKAGTKIKLVFSNPDDMLHNFLVVKPNTVDKVVKAAFDLGLDGDSQGYIPETTDVLFHTGILQPLSEDTIYFQVPRKKGDYTFVCTFPGHGQVMRGILRVK